MQLLRPDGSMQSLIGINNNTAGQVFFMDTQTLATSGSARPPLCSIPAAVSVSCVSLRAITATLAPASARAWAIAR